jgi:hypothetical protein
MRTDRPPLCPEVLEQLGLDGYEPEPCELAHLAAEPYEPQAGLEPDPAHDLAVGLDGITPYER